MKCLVSCFVILAAATAARAQPATINGTPDLVCRTTPGFVVVARNLPDEIGVEFYARPRVSPDEVVPCAFSPKAGDLRLGEPGKPYTIEGMNGRFVVATELVGMAGTIHVYDLSTNKAVVSEPLTQENQTKTSGSQVKFTILSGVGTVKTCRRFAEFKKQGGSGEIGVPARVDLATGTLTRSDKIVCTYAQ